MFYNKSHDKSSLLTHCIRHAMHRGRHAEGFGLGRGGGGFMGGGGMPGGRKLSAGDLQLILLLLLEGQPAHGYELIRAIEERSGGFYVPSPGVIYPSLTYLDEIGHAQAAADGNRKRYSVTEAGRAHLAVHRAKAEAILAALGRIGGRMEQVREAFAGLDALDPAAADEMHRARHALKHALFRLRDCTPAEARRVAAILERATAEILGKANKEGSDK